MPKGDETDSVLDSIRKEKVEAGLESFKLVKYFSFSSLAVILVFTLLLSWIISINARKVMLEQNEEYSLLLAENLSRFSGVLFFLQLFVSVVLP